MPIQRLAALLTYAGALPFILAALSIAFGPRELQGTAITVLITYAAVILSFLGGVEWGLALQGQAGSEPARKRMLAWSVLPSLAAWGVLWLPSPGLQMVASVMAFAAAAIADVLFERRGLLPGWFMAIRIRITAVVCLTLLLARLFY